MNPNEFDGHRTSTNLNKTKISGALKVHMTIHKIHNQKSNYFGRINDGHATSPDSRDFDP